jgi:hypothetical protein
MSTLRRSDLWAAALVAPAVVIASSSAHADEDALAPYRDRFRQGMDQYKAGAMAEAIRTWTAIYEEIGPQRGYRLSFNLARAYEANFETSRAAERYHSFLDEAAARRSAGEALDPIVEREEQEARSRLEDLDAKSGRIRIVSSGRTILAQIDNSDPRLGTFVAYVAPGDHVVVFAPGARDQERHEISVKAGELAVVSAPPEPPPPPVAIPVPPPVERAHRMELQRPIPPILLYVSGGITVASLVAPIVTYAHAISLYNSESASQQPGESEKQLQNQKLQIYNEYLAAKPTAYATLAIPLSLAAITGSLVVYYFAGSKMRDVTIDAGVLPGGGVASLSGSF